MAIRLFSHQLLPVLLFLGFKLFRRALFHLLLQHLVALVPLSFSLAEANLNLRRGPLPPGEAGES